MVKPNRKRRHVSVQEQEEETNMHLNISANKQIDVIENDNTTATSQHEHEGDGRMWKSPHKLRQTIKKPQFFKPMSPNKQGLKRGKRGNSLSASVHTAKAKNSAKKKVKKGVEYRYDEVDYIFGKRPDESRKEKMEYRVMWKATWEPEENLRLCPESIEAYEHGQNIGHNNEKDDSKGKEQRSHSHDDDDDDAANNVTMRKKPIKWEKHSVKRSTDCIKLKEKQRILPTMCPNENHGQQNRALMRQNKLKEQEEADKPSTSANIMAQKEVDRLDINDNQPGPKERSQKLEQMAKAMGLKFYALLVESLSTENYFISAEKVKSKIATMGTPMNNLTTLMLEVYPQPQGPPHAILSYKNSVRGTADKLLWPIPDFCHFFWAIRGLCHEIFFISKREQRLTAVSGHDSNSAAINDSIVLPEVLEPEDEEERSETNREQNHRGSFSIMDAHKELRLEGLIQDTELMLHSSGYTEDPTAKLVITNHQQASKKCKMGLV